MILIPVCRESSFVSNSSRRDSISRHSRRSSGDNIENDDMDHEQKVDDWQKMSLPSVAESPIKDLRIEKEIQPVFVEIRALTKGQVFVSF